MGKPTELGKAITEYGKVYKTKHQLRYISDEIYARQILEQLNKRRSKAYIMSPYILWGKRANSIKPTLTGMEEQLTALSIVTNANYLLEYALFRKSN